MIMNYLSFFSFVTRNYYFLMYLGQLRDSYQLSLFICNFIQLLFSYLSDNNINDNCRNYFVLLIAIKKLYAVTRRKKNPKQIIMQVLFFDTLMMAEEECIFFHRSKSL